MDERQVTEGTKKRLDNEGVHGIGYSQTIFKQSQNACDVHYRMPVILQRRSMSCDCRQKRSA
jgi:hypothetical protein